MEIRRASINDLENLMNSRIEMLRAVNRLSESFLFDSKFLEQTKSFFLNSLQTTVLAYEDTAVIGCATICYIDSMPTYRHPTGRRAHIMNVYTREQFRRQGIALEMMKLLIEDAKENKVTEISLDATEHGRPLYKRLGFVSAQDSMVLLI